MYGTYICSLLLPVLVGCTLVICVCIMLVSVCQRQLVMYVKHGDEADMYVNKYLHSLNAKRHAMHNFSIIYCRI